MRKLLCLLLAALITISTGACTQKPSAPEKPTPSVSGETFSPANYITTGKNTESTAQPPAQPSEPKLVSPDPVAPTPATPEPVAPAPVSPVPVAPEPISETVYITKTGKKYHRDGCSYLRKSKIAIALSEAQASYSPCSKCNP